MYTITPIILAIVTLCQCDDKFPKDFIFGIASSAYQIEGGHNADGKGESIWDYYLRTNPSSIIDASNGNIACDSYHKHKEDVALLQNLGVDFYRFSISWPRILPTGLSNNINPEGIRYYNNLIDDLVARNIQPMVTMYHWDLPKPLQDLGGWTNPLLAEYFADYARILFDNFGDRVKLWVTFNTNWIGYNDDFFPPFLNQSGFAEYLFAKHVILAHAKAYHLYQDKYKESQNGQVGITIDGRWYEPASAAVQDQKAAERVRQFFIGMLANPIFNNGDFPQLVKKRVEEVSKREGFEKSRLPKMTEEEVAYIKGSFDFLGLNIYTTFLVKDVDEDDKNEPSLEKDYKATIYQDSKWPESHTYWLKVVPWGLRKVLSWIKNNYNDPPIFITENGFADNGELNDVGRINYLQLYLSALLEAIHEDKVQVKGYAAWSLLDSFEWTFGYSEKFGLHHVDYSDPERKRTPKASAKWYKELIKRRRLDKTASMKSEL